MSPVEFPHSFPAWRLFPGFDPVDFVHRTSRYYYLFFNYLSYYLYGCPLYANARA